MEIKLQYNFSILISLLYLDINTSLSSVSWNFLLHNIWFGESWLPVIFCNTFTYVVKNIP
jgi:hypothetical protein